MHVNPIRRNIAQAADDLFGGHIDIDERAYQALEIIRINGQPAWPIDIWWSALEVFPGLTELYCQLGLSEPQVPHIAKWIPAREFRGGEIPVEHWKLELTRVFFPHTASHPARPLHPTRAAIMAQKHQRVSIEAVVAGALEASRKTKRKDAGHTSLVARRLAEEAGCHIRVRRAIGE